MIQRTFPTFVAASTFAKRIGGGIIQRNGESDSFIWKQGHVDLTGTMQAVLDAIEQEKIWSDPETKLTWGIRGRSRYDTTPDASRQIRDANANNFQGYDDWRLPTLASGSDTSLSEPSPISRRLPFS